MEGKRLPSMLSRPPLLLNLYLQCAFILNFLCFSLILDHIRWCSEMTPGMFRGTNGMLGIEPRSTACKAKCPTCCCVITPKVFLFPPLPAVLLFWPCCYLFYFAAFSSTGVHSAGLGNYVALRIKPMSLADKACTQPISYLCNILIFIFVPGVALFSLQ